MNLSEHEWVWETNNSDNVQLANKNSIVTFHPKNSSGTAVVRGNQPFSKGRHYYWEVKLETRPYGTDTVSIKNMQNQINYKY